jgi:TctA family transporter
MRNLQRFEAACGLVAALLGFLGVAYALFGPTYSFQNSSGQTGTANLLQVGIPPGAIVALCILSLGLIGVATGAVLHSRTRENWWRIVLLISTVVMVAFLVLTLLSIGLLLLPATLFALVASALSLGVRRAALG